MFHPNDRVIANPEISALSGKIVKYLGKDIYWVEWDQDTEYARNMTKFAACNLRLENAMRFRLGDTVATRWNEDRTGIVVGVVDVDSVRQKVSIHFQREDNRLTYNNSDIILIKRAIVKDEEMAKDVNVISLKPLQSEALIETGNWKYVILENESKKAVAAFVTMEDAEYYVDADGRDLTIREVA